MPSTCTGAHTDIHSHVASLIRRSPDAKPGPLANAEAKSVPPHSRVRDKLIELLIEGVDWGRCWKGVMDVSRDGRKRRQRRRRRTARAETELLLPLYGGVHVGRSLTDHSAIRRVSIAAESSWPSVKSRVPKQ